MRKFLGRVLHGYMKHLPFELTEKFPLTPRVCLAIKPGLDIRRNRDDAMLWWLILLLVFGVLRKSAATVERQRPKDLNKRKMILNRDVTEDTTHVDSIKREFATVETYVSKKDHIGKGIKTFYCDTNSEVNPLGAFRNFISFRRQDRWRTFYTEPDDPHFVWSTGHIVSRRSLDGHLKDLLRRANIDHSQFKGISPRRGGAQGAANAAQSDDTIKYLRDWSSKAYQLYRELSRSHYLQVCETMGQKKTLERFILTDG